jgi:hypothetical protein
VKPSPTINQGKHGEDHVIYDDVTEGRESMARSEEYVLCVAEAMRRIRIGELAGVYCLGPPSRHPIMCTMPNGGDLHPDRRMSGAALATRRTAPGVSGAGA